jgi:succinate dehydrogenase/fumarate reductase flavoprotein subunit
VDYDVVVVGAGTAGIPCALTAADNGARVLLVDKADVVGGTLHVSGGHMSAAGARRQRERGIDDTPDEHYDDIRRISLGTAPQTLTRLAVAHAADTVDWLADHGFEFAAETPRIVYGHEPYTRARTYYGPDAGLSILAVLERMLQPHVAAGTVQLWLGCPVTSLAVQRGRVVGVVAQRAGAPETVRAAAVVLATGGYGGSPEMFAELHDAPLVTAAMPTSTGDGLRMARELGAVVVGADDFIPTFGGLPAADDPTRVYWPDRPLLVAEERTPWEIYVGRDGRRFVAEDLRSIDAKERALVGLDDLTFFMVLDDRAVDESGTIIDGWSPEDVRRRAGRRPGLFVADSIPALAERAGIDAGGLGRTVARYNTMVGRGSDPDFGREVFPATIERPPFYAVRNHGVTLITFAGVAVDDTLAVRHRDGTRINGLYAIGEVIGAAATMGNAFCSGMVITPAITFGRLLGARLATEVT